ncbi:MAG TPA: multicopper oxidase domain-containing protein [Candidatus Thermoplasmatota archaeon]|nr:multicopper oxidase domain-containing protein [Candidatus Thermoplasmatota archaeon]
MTPGTTTRSRVVVIAAVSALVSGALVAAYDRGVSPAPAGAARADAWPAVRHVELDIVGADLEMAPGVVWHAWTYNGTVPGPTIEARVGDTLRITVHNTMDITHSFHTHLSPYALENDGSQINTITGVGKGAMIAPGASYTYEFRPTMPGVFYYHCHSADGGHHIAEHVAQGLYGAIVIEAPDEPPVRDEPLFMAERGFDVDGEGAPYFIMNGKGIPGGEHALEGIFAAEGLEGVVAQFGKTVPLIQGTVGEPVRLSVVNIGDTIHSFHVHGMNTVSVDLMPGRIHPANVVQLVPGGADRVVLTPTEPGVWLFHCHVVAHADAGMIGVFVVEAAGPGSQP